MNEQRIFLVGIGNLGSAILDLCLRLPGKHHFLVGGRNLSTLQQRANLSMLAAMQLGYTPDMACTSLDLWNIDQTADIIARFQPTIILCTATLQRLGATDHLPKSLSAALAVAPMGPRLPLHLPLIHALMQAVKQANVPVMVLNAIYPDVVHPILQKVDLAPTTGIGDLANNLTALKQALASQLQWPAEDLDVRLVMARHVSYWMSRRDVTKAPFHLSVCLHDKDVTSHIDIAMAFEQIRTTWKRTGGTTGLLMTAASAMALLEGIVKNTEIITHAPGPQGLPGGYPVRVNAQGVTVALPENLSLHQAIQINEAGLRLDGIESIDEYGTVTFTDEAVALFKTLLGYDCKRMPLKEAKDWAKVLQARYEALYFKG